MAIDIATTSKSIDILLDEFESVISKLLIVFTLRTKRGVPYPSQFSQPAKSRDNIESPITSKGERAIQKSLPKSFS